LSRFKFIVVTQRSKDSKIHLDGDHWRSYGKEKESEEAEKTSSTETSTQTGRQTASPP
jgi:hypothetical protein